MRAALASQHTLGNDARTLPFQVDRSFGALPERHLPTPRILKPPNLARRRRPILLLKKRIIILGRVKRRIQIHQVHRLILEIPPQDFEIVPVIKRA